MKYVENFPFLTKRFSNGFFLNWVNRHYLLIAYTADRHGYSMDNVLGELFSILYTNRIITLNKYNENAIGKSVYNKLLLKNPDLKPLSELSDEQRCIVVFFILYFKYRSAALDMESELLRIVKLLLVTENIYKGTSIIIRLFKVEINGYSVGIPDNTVIRQSVSRYSGRFSNYLANVRRRRDAPGYNETVQEYHGFLRKFQYDPKVFIPERVRAVVNEYYKNTRKPQPA